jgi:molybdopterin-guanine dinucleotide biosynthesis protein A
MSELLPVHGFVLAGGKSSRMGADKALLEFRGRPMVEIAVEKLRGFCAEVSIAGNREDLSGFAPVVKETRVDCGPVAGIEAGLRAARQDWAMFVPVDVPLVPAGLLRRWAELALEMGAGGGLKIFHLHVWGDQPAFCIARRDIAQKFTASLEDGERKLSRIFHEATSGLDWVHDSIDLFPAGYPGEEMASRWFANINTPEDLKLAESWAVDHS